MRSSFPGWASLLTLFLALSCSSVPEKDSQPSVPVSSPDSIVFTAVFEQNASKTEIGEDYSVLWSTGDKIRVFNSATPEGVEFTLSGGAGTNKGRFSAPGSSMGEGPFYAVYPSEAATTLNGTSIGVRIPAAQEYAADSFGQKANLAAGKGDALEQILFRNLLGVVSFTLTGTRSVRSIHLRSQGSAPLFGTGSISGWEEEAPSVTLDSDAASQEIILDCGTAGAALTAEGTTFHLAVPAGTLGEGFSFEAEDTDGNVMIRRAPAAEGNRIARSGLLRMPAMAYAPTYKSGFLYASEPGAYENVLATSTGKLSPCCLYTEGESQYAFRNTETTRYLRLEDWSDGFMLSVTMPSQMQEGKEYDSFSVKAVGNTGTVVSGDGLTMEVVKMAGDRIWLGDTATGKGYVVLKVDE